MKNAATNAARMKGSNKRLILEIVRRKPISRVELSRITGLTRAAVTMLVDGLLSDGVLVETGTARSRHGRRPVLLDLNPSSLYAIGVSIARDGCAAGIVDLKGSPIATRPVPLDSCAGADQCLDRIAECLRALIAASGVPAGKILGIGVGMPGPVDINTGTALNPPNFAMWHNVRVVERLAESFPFGAFLENNSACLALAEKSFGLGAELGGFMLLVVDTGIGTGIVVNDRLYRGVGGLGSEVGHTTVDLNGPTCGCGNRGCLELYASIPSVIKAIRRHEAGIASWSGIVDGAMDGNTACMEAIRMEARYLAAGIVNAMNILELEAVILSGDVSYKPELLLDRIREHVDRTAMTRTIHRLRVEASSIRESSGLISAASIVIQRFFDGEIENTLGVGA